LFGIIRKQSMKKSTRTCENSGNQEAYFEKNSGKPRFILYFSFSCFLSKICLHV